MSDTMRDALQDIVELHGESHRRSEPGPLWDLWVCDECGKVDPCPTWLVATKALRNLLVGDGPR